MNPWVKQVLESLCQPLTLGTGLAFLGLILVQARRHARIGKFGIALGLAVILLFSYPPVPEFLNRQLAGRHPPLAAAKLHEFSEQSGNTAWITVLSGGYSTNGLPGSGARLDEISLARLAEGVRIYRQIPHGKVLLSVGDLPQGAPQESLADQLADTFGLPRHDLQPVGESTSTRDEAAQVHRIIGTDPFILVTTDTHMPRAMLVFQALGMNPVPAPVGTCGWTDAAWNFTPARLLPKAANLAAADRALHEYLGMSWARLQTFFEGSTAKGGFSPAATGELRHAN